MAYTRWPSVPFYLEAYLELPRHPEIGAIGSFEEGALKAQRIEWLRFHESPTRADRLLDSGRSGTVGRDSEVS
jgi:hypothetical protein